MTVELIIVVIGIVVALLATGIRYYMIRVKNENTTNIRAKFHVKVDFIEGDKVVINGNRVK